MERVLKNYGLSISLFSLFALSWAGQGFYQWNEMINEASQHGQSLKMDEFVPAFLSATFENWQSEFLQLLTFVLLTSFLIHKGSHESKDSSDRMERKIDKIEKLLEKSKK
jgi:hypothetical protein